jgi:hypothetical protein
MPTNDLDVLVGRCAEAEAAVKALEASPRIDDEWEAWETELRSLTAERDRICAEAGVADPAAGTD